MNEFLQVYGTLPRAGPGSDGLTRRAFELLPQLPPHPHILDVGCGPGMQTLALLTLADDAQVTALDLLPQMLARVRAAARRAGVSDRLSLVKGDMGQMDFALESFDLLWSEAAIYILGFTQGLRKFARFVKPGGYLAVSEVVWLKPDPPQEVVDFWQEYPEIDTVDAKLAIIDRLGFEQFGHFVFPPAAWTKAYYDPLAARITEYSGIWNGGNDKPANPEGQRVLTEARREIALFNRYSDYYSYGFFVMRKP